MPPARHRLRNYNETVQRIAENNPVIKPLSIMELKQKPKVSIKNFRLALVRHGRAHSTPYAGDLLIFAPQNPIAHGNITPTTSTKKAPGKDFCVPNHTRPPLPPFRCATQVKPMGVASTHYRMPRPSALYIAALSTKVTQQTPILCSSTRSCRLHNTQNEAP